MAKILTFSPRPASGPAPALPDLNTGLNYLAAKLSGGMWPPVAVIYRARVVNLGDSKTAGPSGPDNYTTYQRSGYPGPLAPLPGLDPTRFQTPDAGYSLGNYYLNANNGIVNLGAGGRKLSVEAAGNVNSPPAAVLDYDTLARRMYDPTTAYNILTIALGDNDIILGGTVRAGFANVVDVFKADLQTLCARAYRDGWKINVSIAAESKHDPSGPDATHQFPEFYAIRTWVLANYAGALNMKVAPVDYISDPYIGQAHWQYVGTDNPQGLAAIDSGSDYWLGDLQHLRRTGTRQQYVLQKGKLEEIRNLPSSFPALLASPTLDLTTRSLSVDAQGTPLSDLDITTDGGKTLQDAVSLTITALAGRAVVKNAFGFRRRAKGNNPPGQWVYNSQPLPIAGAINGTATFAPYLNAVYNYPANEGWSDYAPTAQANGSNATYDPRNFLIEYGVSFAFTNGFKWVYNAPATWLDCRWELLIDNISQEINTMQSIGRTQFEIHLNDGLSHVCKIRKVGGGQALLFEGVTFFA